LKARIAWRVRRAGDPVVSSDTASRRDSSRFISRGATPAALSAVVAF
jgi:hypothetical protein